jgi:hypothetical protein
VRRIFVIDAHLVIAALDMSGLLMQTQIKEIGDHNMSADLKEGASDGTRRVRHHRGTDDRHDARHERFSLAFLARAVPAAWRARVRHAARRLASPLTAITGKEGTR